MHRIKSLIKTTTTLFSASISFFVLINIIALFFIDSINHTPTITDDSDQYIISDLSEDGSVIRNEVFNSLSLEQKFFSAPGTATHPTLAFRENNNSDGYSVGIENIRYDKGQNDDNIGESLLHDSLIFIFGGSTTFGNGVSDEQTWPHYFNLLCAKNGKQAVNFGTEAYDQIREIDKLLYLLRKGYRPSRVIFLDGLNDIGLIPSNNYGTQDQLCKYGYILRSNGLLFEPQLGVRASIRNMIKTLPVMILLNQLKSDTQLQPVDLQTVPLQKDGFINNFDFFEAYEVAMHSIEFYQRKPNHFQNKIVNLYKENTAFLDLLADGYNFQLDVFYQPIGLLDIENKFATPAYANSKQRFMYAQMDSTIVSNIASNVLELHDLSKLITNSKIDPAYRYIDLSHYSPQSNQLIANSIYRHVFHTKPQN